MKKLFYLILAAGMFVSVQTLAQSSFSVQYSMGFGSGDVKTYVSSASLRGAELSYRYNMSPNVAVGADLGWNVFYERRAFDTYTNGTRSLSGVQYRYINFLPIYVSGDYYLKPGEKLNPFVGLGVGTVYVNRVTDMGLYSLTTNTWQFALRPEIGVLVEASSRMNIILAGKYNGAFSNSDLASQAYFTFNVGMVFK